VLVNADAALLLSNKSLLPRATASPSASTARRRRTTKAVVTGNPVRAEIEAIAPPAERFAAARPAARARRRRQPRREGAQRDAAEGAAADRRGERPRVTHQTGREALGDGAGRYTARGVEAEVLPFIDDMPRRLAECDLVVCRAGAITVSELCAAGVASVLVPLVVSTPAPARQRGGCDPRRRAHLLPQAN
jgi:UDP-N-acetylglucosamine--N-acetylmuramyl-(pentapeptide) pyrophosphoryl-undecaprenol N-acetylglucosamine transferase